MFWRTIVADAVQGIIVGGLLAVFTANRIIGWRLFTFLLERTDFSLIVQDIFIGIALAYIAAQILKIAEVTKVNGWITITTGQAAYAPAIGPHTFRRRETRHMHT